MILSSWAFYGLTTAALSACMMLLQEHYKVNGYALAFWNKAACVIVSAPLVFYFGLPSQPLFYFYLALSAVLYAISDVVFFSAITKTSAGAVSRLVPVGSILGFLLWFAVDPALIEKYMAKPFISALIFTTLCASAFFAGRLRKCAVTMEALRAVWFVLFAATVGPMFSKAVTAHADVGQGPYAYVFFQALMMMALWAVYLAIKKPIPLSLFFARHSWQKGLIIGSVSAGAVLMKVLAFYFVDNPAYIPAVIALDSVIILFVYRLWGRSIEGDIRSGLAVVACAAALIILKAQVK